MRIITIAKDSGWTLVPGPSPWVAGLFSTDLTEKHSFDHVSVSDLLRHLATQPGVTKTSQDENTYWDYEYVFGDAEGLISFDIWLFEEPSQTWGGSRFWGDFWPEGFCRFFAVLEMMSPNLKVHSPECELLSKDEFVRRLSK